MARKNTKLFRESALERLSSPEQLDRLLRVTRPHGWAAMIAIWALLGVVIAWAFLGRVHTREPAQGILVAGGRLQQVVTPYQGRLIDLAVEIGDEIAIDQPIATLDQTNMRDRLSEIEAQIEELTEQHAELDTLDTEAAALDADLAETETARHNADIETAEAQIRRLTQQRIEIDDLITDGILPVIRRHEIDDRIEATRSDIRRSRLALDQLDARLRTNAFERQKDARTRRMKMSELMRSRDTLADRLARETTVRSALAGTVVEIRATEHDTMAAGDALLLLEPIQDSDRQLDAVLYVSADTGKRIEPGMEVQLSPSTVRQEEFGSMKGTVEFIAAAPTSTSAMMTVLSDRDLVDALTRQVGVPLMMRVALERDPETPSGYAWTSSEGPPRDISPGTLCRATVSVKTQRPIELVIPMIRSRLDGE